MEINIKINVFDDPEYCQGDHPRQCNHLSIYDSNCYNDEATCDIFFDAKRNVTDLIGSKLDNKWIKCDQCKEAYQKSVEIEKRNRPITETKRICHKCGVDREGLQGEFITPCPACGDEIPF